MKKVRGYGWGVTGFDTTKGFIFPSITPCKWVKGPARDGAAAMALIWCTTCWHCFSNSELLPSFPRRGPISSHFPFWDTSGVSGFEACAWNLAWLHQACTGVWSIMGGTPPRPWVHAGISTRQKPICNVWSTIDIGTGHRSLTSHFLDSSYLSVRSLLNVLSPFSSSQEDFPQGLLPLHFTCTTRSSSQGTNWLGALTPLIYISITCTYYQPWHLRGRWWSMQPVRLLKRRGTPSLPQSVGRKLLRAANRELVGWELDCQAEVSKELTSSPLISEFHSQQYPHVEFLNPPIFHIFSILRAFPKAQGGWTQYTSFI